MTTTTQCPLTGTVWTVAPVARKSWTFSHGYGEWSYYVNTAGKRMAVKS